MIVKTLLPENCFLFIHSLLLWRRAWRRRHFCKDRNREHNTGCVHQSGIRIFRLNRLGIGCLHIGHILVAVTAVGRQVKLLQISGILSFLNVTLSDILGSSHDGTVSVSPWPPDKSFRCWPTSGHLLPGCFRWWHQCYKS